MLKIAKTSGRTPGDPGGCRQFSSAESTAKAEPVGEETGVFRRGDGLMECQKKGQPIDLNILKSHVRSWFQWIQKHVGVVSSYCCLILFNIDAKTHTTIFYQSF